MKIIWVVWGCLLFALSGCAVLFPNAHLGEYQYTRLAPVSGQSKLVIPVYIDGDFGEADQLSIDDAIQQWNYALNGYAELRVIDRQFDVNPMASTVRDRNSMLVHKINSHNLMVRDESVWYWTLGFVERIGARDIYLVRDRLENEDVPYVLLHELGHALGARHRSEGLMSPHYSKVRYRCIDKETMRQVARYNHWPADRLNYCVVGMSPSVFELQKGQDHSQLLIDSVGGELGGDEVKLSQ